MYVGQQYLQARTTGDQDFVMPIRPTNKLCHRIDSVCVQKGSISAPKLFGTFQHPVDLKYNALEDNAFTQVHNLPQYHTTYLNIT